MTTNVDNINELFDQLELELKSNQLWQGQPPSQQAMMSLQPFAVDTLEGHEWLQWVFLPKMRTVLETGHVLPHGFSVSPYFEQFWANSPQCSPALAILVQLDKAFQAC